MSFAPSKEEDGGDFVRKPCNPEDITNDGKPRFVKLRQIGEKRLVENELEVDREKVSLSDIEGFKEGKDEEDKSLMLNIMADLASENMVLLGNSRIDDKTVEELLKKNEEWESWKRDRNITKWIPPKRGAKAKKDKSGVKGTKDMSALTSITKKKGSTKREPMLLKKGRSSSKGES